MYSASDEYSPVSGLILSILSNFIGEPSGSYQNLLNLLSDYPPLLCQHHQYYQQYQYQHYHYKHYRYQHYHFHCQHSHVAHAVVPLVF